MVGRPGGGDGGRVVRGLGGGVESAGQVGARELRLLAGVGEESRGERGEREKGRGRGALARPYRTAAEAVGGGRGVAEEDEKHCQQKLGVGALVNARVPQRQVVV